MVLNCVAYGCNNVQDARKPISFHTFPFKRPEILELWVKAIRRESWLPSKTSRLCGEHFLSVDYQIRPGCNTKLLKLDAVPSIFSFPKHLLKKATPRRKFIRHDMADDRVKEEPMIIDFGVTTPGSIKLPASSARGSNLLRDQETQTAAIDDKLFRLKRQVKTLKQKVKRRNLKVSTMKHLIKEISKSGYSNENLNTVLKNYFEGLPLELVLLQKTDSEIKDRGQRRYSTLMQQFAHTLYFYSYSFDNFHIYNRIMMAR